MFTAVPNRLFSFLNTSRGSSLLSSATIGSLTSYVRRLVHLAFAALRAFSIRRFFDSFLLVAKAPSLPASFTSMVRIVARKCPAARLPSRINSGDETTHNGRMRKEYEQLIDEFLESMERVKAPLDEFYDALEEAERAIRARINIGTELGERN